jgi:hypothetical protein
MAERPKDISRKARQNVLNILAAVQARVWPCAQDGETSHRIGDNPDVVRTLRFHNDDQQTRAQDRLLKLKIDEVAMAEEAEERDRIHAGVVG